MSEPSEQAAKILGPLSGTATVWALDLGLRLGLFEYLADRGTGATAGEVAEELHLDPQYTHVVLRAAYAAEVLDLVDGRYRLAEHMATLMLDADAPGYLGGAIRTFVALRETYLDLRTFARTGGREWWSNFDPEWIDAVAENGQTYYRRLLNAVFPRLPAVTTSLGRGARYLDLACGVSRGPAKVAAAFPGVTATAVDGDAYEFTIPEREQDCRSTPGRLMCAVQFFEANIGCQLLPTARFVDLLQRAGFRDVGVIDVTPVHVVVHGTK